jgi:hypothetical protein
MNKLIQTIALSAVIISPLSLISSIESAAAHHTPSHVSTTAVKMTQATKKKTKKAPVKGSKKPMTNGTSNKKPADTDATTPSGATPSTGDSQMNPTTQPTTNPDAVPSSKGKPSNSGTDSELPKSGTNNTLPGTPASIPGSVPANGTSVPSVPSVPSGTPK